MREAMIDAGSTAAARERAALRRRLRRSERLRRLEAALLVAPLFLYLLVFFLVPILGMLWRSVDNTELRAVMPRTRRRSANGTARDCRRAGLRHLGGRTARGLRGQDARLGREAPRLRRPGLSQPHACRPRASCRRRRMPDRGGRRWSARPAMGRDRRPGRRSGARHRRGPRSTCSRRSTASSTSGARSWRCRRIRRSMSVSSCARSGSASWSRRSACCSATRLPTSSRRCPPRISNLLLIFVLLPFWTSLLVRTAPGWSSCSARAWSTTS